MGRNTSKTNSPRNRWGHDRQFVLHETPYLTVMKESFFAEAVECWNSLQASELPVSIEDSNMTVTPEIGEANYDNETTNMTTGEVIKFWMDPGHHSSQSLVAHPNGCPQKKIQWGNEVFIYKDYHNLVLYKWAMVIFIAS